ncbi:MAG: hypothetical protein RRA92_09790, partial [Gemmatimonadota bacterium]|nr:hypothetical protein [Gemmatimonadota bacterium]
AGDVAGLLAALDTAPAGPAPDGAEAEGAEAGPESAPENPAVRHCWERILEPAVLRRLVSVEDPDFEALDRILERAGPAAADAMLDRLSGSESLAMRRRTFDRLVAIGPVVAPLTAERILRPDTLPWFVLRNMLALLVEFEGVPDGFSPLPLCAHPHAQVRCEAMKLALRVPEARDDTVRAALSDNVDRILALGVAAAEAGTPAGSGPRLIELALDPHRDPEIRLPAIRALGRLATGEAVEALLSLCAPRRRVLRGDEPPVATPEACAALRALATGWPGDLRVTALADLVRRAGEPALREALEDRP